LRLRRSRRKRYTHYVIGQLTQIALTYYDVTVDVIVVDQRQEADGCHVTFRLDFVKKGAGSTLTDSRCAQARARVGVAKLPAVYGTTFFTVKN